MTCVFNSSFVTKTTSSLMQKRLLIRDLLSFLTKGPKQKTLMASEIYWYQSSSSIEFILFLMSYISQFFIKLISLKDLLFSSLDILYCDFLVPLGNLYSKDQLNSMNHFIFFILIYLNYDFI